jgi:hypothetical protein
MAIGDCINNNQQEEEKMQINDIPKAPPWSVAPT